MVANNRLPPRIPMFGTSPLPTAQARPSLPHIFAAPSPSTDPWACTASPAVTRPNSITTRDSASMEGEDYAAHLGFVGNSGTIRTAKASQARLSPSLATPLSRTPSDQPTAALSAENALSLISQPSGSLTRPADTTLQLHLQSGDRRKKHAPGPVRRLTHQRTMSTLSIASTTSLHGTNLPGWQEFDTLPRGQGELTSFPKFQSNCMRSSSIKRIGAKITEETNQGLTGIGRFFSKVWMRRNAQPTRHQLGNERNWHDEDEADMSDSESRMLDLNTISHAGKKDCSKNADDTMSSSASSVVEVRPEKLCHRCKTTVVGHSCTRPDEATDGDTEVAATSWKSGGVRLVPDETVF
jgi:hypothetical protein